MRTSRAVVLITALLLTGCGGAGEIVPIAPQTATLEELTGPWRASPLRLDAAWRARIIGTCRRDMEAPPGATEGIVDARGAGVVTVRLTGVGMAKCEALHVTPAGQLNGAGGGMTSGRDDTLAPPDRTLGFPEAGFVMGGELRITGWSVTGRAGRGIERVEVVTATHPPIVATVENGWYAAWWPAVKGDRRVENGILPEVRIRGYDAAGTLISERRAR